VNAQRLGSWTPKPQDRETPGSKKPTLSKDPSLCFGLAIR
jgi:hypothetical protein